MYLCYLYPQSARLVVVEGVKGQLVKSHEAVLEFESALHGPSSRLEQATCSKSKLVEDADLSSLPVLITMCIP